MGIERRWGRWGEVRTVRGGEGSGSGLTVRFSMAGLFLCCFVSAELELVRSYTYR